MLIQKDETAIQVLKILYKQNKKKNKKIKKTHYQAIYPRAIEAKYKTKLSSYFQPLIDYVNKFLKENEESMLRGDSRQLKLDVLPGGTFKRMIQSLEGWLSVYMPTIPELKEGQNNVIFMGLNQTAEELKSHEDNQFQKQMQNGIGVSFQTNATWWPDTKSNWIQNNYSLIVSNARNYVNQINNVAEQAVVSGWSVSQLQEQIKKATNGLSGNKCRLLARDQIGKLQGQVAEAQMEEIGLEMYVWSTSGDERVRSTHIPMDGLLCRWDDATVYSKDNGKTWINRPANAVRLHPGQDIQCRCVALAYIPELLSEVSATSIDDFDVVEISKEAEQLNDNLLEQNILLQQKDVLNSLSTSEKKAFKHYTSAYYNSVNNYLENRTLNYADKKQAKKLIDKMDKAFLKAKPLDFDITLFRREWANNNYSPTYVKGEIFKIDKYVSTSISKNNQKEGSIDYIIKVPKGITAGLYIAGMSSYNEMEFLLNRGMQYKVLEVIEKDNLHKKFVLELLGSL